MFAVLYLDGTVVAQSDVSARRQHAVDAAVQAHFALVGVVLGNSGLRRYIKS